MKLQLSDDTLKRRLNGLRERMQPRLRRILAIATDGCTATAAVIRTADGIHLEIEALATSRALKFESMAEELLAGLKSQGISIPKQTILLSAYMLPAVLELPIAAAKPLAAGQMLEMIRWELEPLFAQLNALWSIGGLLYGRGYLSDTQRQELLAAHRAVPADTPVRGGRLAAARFGELAIKKGFAGREQVEECLALQEELQPPDADILIGWHADAVGPGRDPGQSAWLCAGISPVIRTRWVDALERLGQHVQWLYPLASASAPLAALSALPLVLELHSLFGICYRQKNGMVTQLHYRQFTNTALSDNEALDMVRPLAEPGDRLLAVYPGKDWETLLAEAFKGQLPQEITSIADNEVLLPVDTDTPAAVVAALAGAGAHALGLAPPASAVRLAGSKPPPPLHLRPEVWMGAAVALVLFAISGFEINHFMQQRTLMEKHQALIERQTEFEAGKNRIERAIQAEAEMKTKLAAVKAELEATSLRQVFFERALGRRGQFMEIVVDALNDLISDELLLESVAETGWQQLEIQGFALNAEAAYRYARSLARELGHFGIKLGDLDTGEAQGPLGLAGYRFSFVLLKTDEAGAR